MKRLASTLGCAAGALLLWTGCHYSNPHGDQALAPTIRLETEPAGATVVVERLNMQFESPCELPHTVYESDTITVSAEGYPTYRGTIEAIPQVAHGTYRLHLGR